MEQNRTAFGRMPDGTVVEEITLRGEQAACKIITYGGAVRSLTVPGRDASPVDVALGFDTLEDYTAQDKYIGALVGRCANRVGGAAFTLNGREYRLAANDGANSLHGGLLGFDKQVWTVEEQAEDRVTLSLVSPDGQEGYPGTLKVKVTYSIRSLFGEGLSIRYWAVCDQDTVFNPTSHIYFNLSGHDSGPVEGQYIRLNASHYTPAAPGLIPTGELAAVEGTPMDLREMRPIGARIGSPFDQLIMAGGYDHNWVIGQGGGPGKGLGAVRAAEAESVETGVRMEVYSDMPGVQFYTGNFLSGCPAGKGGAAYGGRSGFCLETQFFPDSPNHPQFPSCVLRAGEEFQSVTHYTFCPCPGGRAGQVRH